MYVDFKVSCVRYINVTFVSKYTGISIKQTPYKTDTSIRWTV